MSYKKALEYAIKTIQTEFASYARVKRNALVEIDRIAKRETVWDECTCPNCGSYHCSCYQMIKKLLERI